MSEAKLFRHLRRSPFDDVFNNMTEYWDYLGNWFNGEPPVHLTEKYILKTHGWTFAEFRKEAHNRGYDYVV